MPTILRQYDPAYFKIVGQVLTASDSLANQLIQLQLIRANWIMLTARATATSATIVARVPWVPSDNPTATNQALHLRSILSCTDSAGTAELRLSSLATGQDLTIYNAPGNTFSTNSTDPVIVESNVNLFNTPSNVFDPTNSDILILTLSGTGPATARCDYAEMLLAST